MKFGRSLAEQVTASNSFYEEIDGKIWCPYVVEIEATSLHGKRFALENIT
jgi:hypothetical protein